jgi:hypothetical protein
MKYDATRTRPRQNAFNHVDTQLPETDSASEKNILEPFAYSTYGSSPSETRGGTFQRVRSQNCLFGWFHFVVVRLKVGRNWRHVAASCFPRRHRLWLTSTVTLDSQRRATFYPDSLFPCDQTTQQFYDGPSYQITASDPGIMFNRRSRCLVWFSGCTLQNGKTITLIPLRRRCFFDLELR